MASLKLSYLAADRSDFHLRLSFSGIAVSFLVNHIMNVLRIVFLVSPQRKAGLWTPPTSLVKATQ